MRRKAKALRHEVSGLSRSRCTEPYPVDLRRRIADLTDEWVRSGRSLGELSRLLGIRPTTLRRWCEGRVAVRTSTSLVPVRVKEERSHSELKVDPVAQVVVVSPMGWRLEGLSAVEAIAVVRTVG